MVSSLQRAMTCKVDETVVMEALCDCIGCRYFEEGAYYFGIENLVTWIKTWISLPQLEDMSRAAPQEERRSIRRL